MIVLACLESLDHEIFKEASIANYKHSDMNDKYIKFGVLVLVFSLTACASHPLVREINPVPPEEYTISMIVARDLAQNNECNSGSGEDGVVLNKYMVSAKDLVSDSWIEAYINPEMWVQMKDLIDPLRRVNDDDRLMDWGASELGKLKIVDLSILSMSEREQLLATVRCFITFLMPVVSSDGNSALVCVHVGPSPHGAVAFYVLVKVRDEWMVSASEFFDFM